MRVLGPYRTILESLSQFGNPCPKPRLPFNVDEVLTVYKLSLNLSHAAINQIKQSEDENIKILTSYVQSVMQTKEWFYHRLGPRLARCQYMFVRSLFWVTPFLVCCAILQVFPYLHIIYCTCISIFPIRIWYYYYTYMEFMYVLTWLSTENPDSNRSSYWRYTEEVERVGISFSYGHSRPQDTSDGITGLYWHYSQSGNAAIHWCLTIDVAWMKGRSTIKVCQLKLKFIKTIVNTWSSLEQ